MFVDSGFSDRLDLVLLIGKTDFLASVYGIEEFLPIVEGLSFGCFFQFTAGCSGFFEQQGVLDRDRQLSSQRFERRKVAFIQCIGDFALHVEHTHDAITDQKRDRHF